MLLWVKNAPVAIEPSVDTIEVEMSLVEDDVRRDFLTVLYRVPPSKASAKKLPMIVDVQNSHVFSTTQDLDAATLLLQYSCAGAISAVFTRDSNHSWERASIPEEYAGATIKNFSARYIFKNVQDRNECMRLVSLLVSKTKRNSVTKKDMDTMQEVFKLLARSHIGPVAVPVAALKQSAEKVTST